MRATARMVVVILMLCAPMTCAAGGVNLAWNECLSEGGVTNKSFACGTNTGNNVMVASFVLSAGQTACTGIEATVEVTAQAESLPAWWQVYNIGVCRQTALSVAFDFSSSPATSCSDMWFGQGTGGLGAYQTFWTSPQVPSGLADQARIRLAAAVPSTSPMQLAANTEYYAFKLIVSNAKTVGTGACGGCQTPVCIMLSELNVVQSDGQHENMLQAATSNLITWQGASSCPGAMASQNSTWGQIRSILR